MKKLYFTVTAFLFITIAIAQIVNIPDANFKAKLLSASPSNQIASTETPDIAFNTVSSYHSIDTNNDGEIQVSEASAIKFLNIYRNNTDSEIYDCSGLSSFVNLIYLRFDLHNVTNFNVSGLSNLTFLQCVGNQISNLNLDGLSNLMHLDCSWNQLSTLNLNSLVNLKTLLFSFNNISIVDLSNLNLLESIICDSTPIFLSDITFGNPSNLKYLSCNNISSTNINLTSFPNLNHLYCGQNQLTSLNLSGLNNLMTLSCPNNQITSLNLSNLGILTRFDCSFNPLLFTNINFGASTYSIFEIRVNGIGATNIDFSVLPNLDILDCSQNQLTNLDLSDNYSLQYLSCHTNNLISINIKNGAISNNTNSLSIGNNPNLAFICADTGELSFVQQIINSSANINCHVNSYCSFTPGGTFYAIQGTNRIDTNNDGCNAQDIVYPYLKLNFTNGSNVGSSISNDSGTYSVPVSAGAHAFTPQLENPSYFNVSPTSATVSFPSTASPFIQNFCLTPNGIAHDLEIIIIPIDVARPGFDATYKIIYRNKGNQTENASINFNFNDTVLDFVSSNITPISQNVNTLSWNVGTLVPFQIGEILVTFNVNSPTEIPAVNNGDVLNYTTTISPIVNDALPNDNTFNFNQIVVGSYDPNDKECLEGAIINPSMIGSYVHYKIRFENTGTYPAQNVVIKDEIDTTKFDISTLQITDTSHSCVTRITNTNKVEFIFENINLPFDDANNDGYVVFKIKTKPTLSVGSTISNLANIYFDYNFPIVTNTATSTFTALGINEVENKSIVVYPNPSRELINITSNDLIKTIELYDIQGRLLMTKLNDSQNATLELSSQNAGTYFVKVITAYGVKIEKVLKN